MHSLNVEVGRTIGVGANQDPGLGKMQTQQFDALLQRACLATPERTEHQRWDLDIKTIIVSTCYFNVYALAKCTTLSSNFDS